MSEHHKETSEAAESGLPGLTAAWRELRHDPDKEVPPYQLPPSPYPGLRSFTPSEGLLYFGRPGEDEALAKRLESFNVVGVLGGSGSGKSSLVLAGLLPYLKRFQRIPDRGGRWYLVTSRPGKRPSQNIVDAIWLGVCKPLAKRKFGERALAATFSQLGVTESLTGETLLSACEGAFRQFLAPNGIIDRDRLIRFANEELQMLDSISSGGMQVGAANLLIVLDQFEEIFREGVDGAGADAVVELVKTVHNRGRQGLFLTLTMRSEELHRCAEYDGLSGIIFATSIQVELLTKERDIHAAIIEPARRVFDAWGIPYAEADLNEPTSPFARDLVDFLTQETQRLSKTLDHKPDSLPLLQHALRAIWDRALQRWSEEYPQNAQAPRPELRIDDFLYRSETDPLQACLNGCAELARVEASKALESAVYGNLPADQIIDSSFISMARLDDRGRWIRRFATAKEIAATTVLDIQDRRRNGFINRIFALMQRKSAYFLFPKDKEPLVDVVLDVFRRRGYVFARNDLHQLPESASTGGLGRIYDVSHESLIRSWGRYQTLLEQAKSTRKAFLQALEAQKALRDTQGKWHYFQKLLSWIKGGERRQAAEALRHVTFTDLARLFLPPRQFGEIWAENQIVDEVQRSNKQRLPLNELENARQDEPVRVLARHSVADVSSLFKRAREWNEADGLRPSGKTRWLAKIALLPAAAVIAIAVLGINNRSSAKVITLLGDVAGISDEWARNDPVSAHSQLILALIRAGGVSAGDWSSRIAQTADTIDTAMEILNQKARTILKHPVGREGDGNLLPATKKEIKITCRPVNKDPKNPLVKTAYFDLVYSPLSGYSFVSNDDEHLRSQPVAFDGDDKICVDEEASMLLRVQRYSLVLYPLTVIYKQSSGGLTSRLIQINEPNVVTPYSSSSTIVDTAFSDKVMADIFRNIADREVRSFEMTASEVIQIPLEAPGKFLYVSQIAGINQPQPLSAEQCKARLANCSAVSRGSFSDIDFPNLNMEGSAYTLNLQVAANNGSKSSGCAFDEVSCAQYLSLYRWLDGEDQRGVRLRLVHIGVPIVNAIIDSDGYLIVLDTSGRAWRYVVGTSAFSSALDNARRAIFPNGDDDQANHNWVTTE